jgi:hypothetical protein
LLQLALYYSVTKQASAHKKHCGRRFMFGLTFAPTEKVAHLPAPDWDGPLEAAEDALQCRDTSSRREHDFLELLSCSLASS